MRSMLGSFPTEKITLRKADGTTISDIVALVEPKHIFVDDASVPIEEGDFFERKLPNDSMEYYEVLDRGFYKGMHGIPDHYQTSVQKSTSKRYNEHIVYNISNQNGHVNINSIDNSQNIAVELSNEDAALFETLKSLAQPLDNSGELCNRIEEMKKEVGKKDFASKYNRFIQSAANHMTVFSPFIPLLSSLLTK